MNMERAPFSCALWFFCVGLVWSRLPCEWKPLGDDNVMKEPSFEDGAKHLRWRLDISDAEACRDACCLDPECQMALLGFPMDAPAQCRLVTCVVDGRDLCVLRDSSASQFRLVGWKERPLRAVPLVGNSEPSSNKTDDQPLLAVPLLEASEPSKNNSPEVCLLPKVVGSCRAAFPRFYYDIDSQTCRSFTYGGCEGNLNNFETLEECQATCSGVTGSVNPDESTTEPPGGSAKSARMAHPIADDLGALRFDDEVLDKVMSADDYSELCEAEPATGLCRAAFRRWHYDSQQRDCKLFIYGGCEGNKNNYYTKKSCLDTCYVAEEECLSSPDPGPCRAAFPKFYFDSATGSCQSFIYGGCRGNKNRYDSAEECQARCGAAFGSFAGRWTHTRWTAAFFVLLTLAAICTLLVSALVVTILRRLTVTRRASVFSDKEELLPEVRSSLESLNMPPSPTAGKA
ncbi:kunitz-type protease inhibitor 2 [Festucalex cinctus]